MENPGLMTVGDVLQVIGLGRSTFYVLLKRGQFPAPLRLSPRRVAWLERDVRQWLDERSDERKKV